MAAAAESLLLPFRASSHWVSRLTDDIGSECQLRNAGFKATVPLTRSLSLRSRPLLCRAVADLQPRPSPDNGRLPLPFATQASESLSLQPTLSHQTQVSSDVDSEDFAQVDLEKRWRRGNVDKKSARKWVRESIEWEATGMRTRGRAEELLRVLGKLPAGASIDDVMTEYAGRASVESLNDVVKGLGRLNDWPRSLAVFHWMHASRYQKPNAYTYTNIIATLGRSHQVAAAKKIFDTMREEEVERNIFHYNAMLACYTRNSLVPEALSLFQEMEERALPLDAYTFSNMINACVKGNLGLDRALQLFDRMERSGLKGDLVVYSSLLHACVAANRVAEAERVLEEMGKAGHSPNLYIYTEMIKLYARAGNWRSAETMFYDMKRKKQKMDNTLYTAMIDAYGRCGQYDEALSVFYDMRTAGYEPDVVTYSALVAACAAIGDYTEAGSIVEVMVNSGVAPNAFTYTSLIQAAGKAGEGDDIAMLVGQMQEAGLALTSVTHAVIVDAYGRCKRFEEMEDAVTAMRQSGYAPNLKVYTTMVTAYALAGDEAKLREWFARVKEDGLAPDLRLWTTFVYGLGKAGQYGAMMEGLQDMNEAGVPPNEATYTAVLDALFGGGQYADVISAFRDMEAAELRTDRATFKRLCKQLSLAHRALRRADEGVTSAGGEGDVSRARPGAWSPEKLAAIEEYEKAVRGLLKEIEEDDELEWGDEEEDGSEGEGADVSGEVGDVGTEGVGTSAQVGGAEEADVSTGAATVASVSKEDDEESDLESEWTGLVARAMKQEAAVGSEEQELRVESVSSGDAEESSERKDAGGASGRRLAEAEALVRGWADEDEDAMGGEIEPAERGGGEESAKEGDAEWVWDEEDAYLEDAEEFETLEDFLEFEAEDLEADFNDDFDPNVDYKKLAKEKKQKEQS